MLCCASIRECQRVPAGSLPPLLPRFFVRALHAHVLEEPCRDMITTGMMILQLRVTDVPASALLRQM